MQGCSKWSVPRRSLRRVHWRSLTKDNSHSLKRKENWRKSLLLGIQTGDKLAKPPFFVTFSRLCRHCRNLAEGGCFLSRFHFTRCRYFFGHVACRNLPWQGLRISPSWVYLMIGAWCHGHAQYVIQPCQFTRTKRHRSHAKQRTLRTFRAREAFFKSV